MAVQLELPQGGQRFFHDVIARFDQVSDLGRYAEYRAVLRPWLWRLTLRAGCRIFQHMTVPEVVKSVLREHGSRTLSRTCRARTLRRSSWSNTVRPTSTSSAACSSARVSTTSSSTRWTGTPSCSPTATAPTSPSPATRRSPTIPSKRRGDVREIMSTSGRSPRSLRPARAFSTTTTSRAPRPTWRPSSSLVQSRASAEAELEIYDYPGSYSETSQGETYARVRLEEHNAQQERTQGEGDVRGMTVGALFTLTNHPRQDQNREYLVVSATYHLQALDYESGGKGTSDDAGRVCHCSFRAIPSSIPFRTASTTVKPNIRGVQTARVVGKEGQEIWTDEYGRVKLQFRWDREGGANEDSSCWVRVAQLWSGASWGGLQVPRIGQEVIVEFLEGDPDRPLVTGRVYNADNMPPYALPSNQTQSGIKSRSTPDGSPENFNELRFVRIPGAFDHRFRSDPIADSEMIRSRFPGTRSRIPVTRSRIPERSDQDFRRSVCRPGLLDATEPGSSRIP
ncbi:MAG: type VI secretion system tip protein TssI/VgrG, partial [Myxococcota bacterium]